MAWRERRLLWRASKIRGGRWDWYIWGVGLTAAIGYVVVAAILQPPSWWMARLGDGTLLLVGALMALVITTYLLHGHGIRIRLQHVETLRQESRLHDAIASPFGAALAPAQREQVCSGCGYDLRGNASDQCPECGRDVGYVSAIDDDPVRRERETVIERQGTRY